MRFKEIVYIEKCEFRGKCDLIFFFFFSETNMRMLKDNIETFFKKESNFKRPLKIEVIYAKLTKGFVPHYEWNGHRRRMPWKILKKDQTGNVQL